jgi:Tfp pilus assembly protein PilF
MWGSRVSDTAKRRERFERKLYARPKDRKTLLAFQNFLYEQGQYEYAKRVFAQ